MRAFLLGLFVAASTYAAPQPVTFKASDGVTVYGEYYSAGSKAKPVILLFHRAGSNHAEYSTIAPKLVDMGFNALAIDQRSGGTLWGVHNRTAAEFKKRFNKKAEYGDALKDMEAALQWAGGTGHSGGVIVWGSSYSAALVFVLAAQHPNEVKAVLAFSPSEYLDGPDVVSQAAAKVTCPVFIDSAKNAKEIAAAKKILDAVSSKNKTQFEPGTAGVHGSPTLRQDSDPQGAEENWKAVSQFLSQLH